MRGAVVFDLDGVILESVDIKTMAFAEVFADHPEHVPAIVRHHLANLGISRQRKIEWVYRELLRRPLPPEEATARADRFAALVKEAVISCPFVEGAPEALLDLARDHDLYVASGTPHAELQEILAARGLAKQFAAAWGAPHDKADTVRRVLAARSLPPEAVVFVGDASTDHGAALATGVRFIARRTAASGIDWDAMGVPAVSTLRELPALVRAKRGPA